MLISIAIRIAPSCKLAVRKFPRNIPFTGYYLSSSGTATWLTLVLRWIGSLTTLQSMFTEGVSLCCNCREWSILRSICTATMKRWTHVNFTYVVDYFGVTILITFQFPRISKTLQFRKEECIIDDAILLHIVANTKWTCLKEADCTARGILNAFEVISFVSNEYLCILALHLWLHLSL